MLPIEKKIVKLCNDEVIAYLEGGEGDKTLVCIHGNMASSVFMYDFILNAPKGYRVICPDLNGFGNSSYKNSVSSLKELADNIHSFLMKLKIKSYALLGWSLGAGVAMELASTYPECVSHLFLVAATPCYGYPIYKKTDEGFLPYSSKEEMASDPVVMYNKIALETNNLVYLKNAYNMAIYTINKPSDDIFDQQIMETAKQVNIVDVDWALATLNITDVPSLYSLGSNKIKDISCPVYFMQGDKDLMVPMAFAEKNVEFFNGKAKLITYPNSAHAIWIDKKEDFFSDLIKFLE